MGLGILDSRPQAARPVAFIDDCAIPVERLGEFVREVERIMSAHGTEGGIYAHASAGCLHIRPILNLQSGEGVRSMRSIAEQTLALTLRLGGSMSSEHGDGIVRGEWLKQTYGEEVIDAMRVLKQAADPHNILNPHKMFDAPPMDSHLRYGAEHISAGVDFRAGFFAQRRIGDGHRAVQWTGRVPKIFGRDVPVVSGDARGKQFDAGQGKFVAGALITQSKVEGQTLNVRRATFER